MRAAKRGFFSHLLRMLFTRDDKKHPLSEQMPLGAGYYRDKDGRKILIDPRTIVLTKAAKCGHCGASGLVSNGDSEPLPCPICQPRDL
jgi:hypothetical protein